MSASCPSHGPPERQFSPGSGGPGSSSTTSMISSSPWKLSVSSGGVSAAAPLSDSDSMRRNRPIHFSGPKRLPESARRDDAELEPPPPREEVGVGDSPPPPKERRSPDQSRRRWTGRAANHEAEPG